MQGHYFVSEWPEGNAYGVTLQVAENLNSDRGRVKTQPGQTQRENTALPRNARGARRDVEKRTTCRALQVVRFRSDQCPACGAWYEITSKKREPANRPSTLPFGK